MVEILLVRPGSTDFDEQGRIQGNLDIPLNELGNREVARLVDALRSREIAAVYSAACQPAEETAAALATALSVKHKRLETLTNLNHGLWQGMMLDEVKHKHPKVFRKWEEDPDSICPPEGESLADVRERVEPSLKKLLKKHKEGVIVLVAPEPMMSVIRSFLKHEELGNLWNGGAAGGTWEAIHVDAPSLVGQR